MGCSYISWQQAPASSYLTQQVCSKSLNLPRMLTEEKKQKCTNHTEIDNRPNKANSTNSVYFDAVFPVCVLHFHYKNQMNYTCFNKRGNNPQFGATIKEPTASSFSFMLYSNWKFSPDQLTQSINRSKKIFFFVKCIKTENSHYFPPKVCTKMHFFWTK